LSRRSDVPWRTAFPPPLPLTPALSRPRRAHADLFPIAGPPVAWPGQVVRGIAGPAHQRFHRVPEGIELRFLRWTRRELAFVEGRGRGSSRSFPRVECGGLAPLPPLALPHLAH